MRLPMSVAGSRPEQPRRGRVEPEDLLLGVENDAGVAERPGALAHLAQQAVILLLAVARLASCSFSTRANISAHTPRVSNSGARGAPCSVMVEQIEIAQRVARRTATSAPTSHQATAGTRARARARHRATSPANPNAISSVSATSNLTGCEPIAGAAHGLDQLIVAVAASTPCAGGECARRRYAPRRRRCRPRRDRATASGYRRDRDGA